MHSFVVTLQTIAITQNCHCSLKCYYHAFSASPSLVSCMAKSSHNENLKKCKHPKSGCLYYKLRIYYTVPLGLTNAYFFLMIISWEQVLLDLEVNVDCIGALQCTFVIIINFMLKIFHIINFRGLHCPQIF